MLLIISLIVFSGCYHRDSLHLCQHKLRTQISGLYRYFRVVSSLYKNWLKFPEWAVYKAKILKLDDLVSSSVAQTFKVCCAQ
jgi:hypothetical protein